MAPLHTPVLPNIWLCGSVNNVRLPWSAAVCDVKCSRGKSLPRQGSKGIKQSPAEKAAGWDSPPLCVCLHFKIHGFGNISHFSKGTIVALKSGRSNSKRSQRGYTSSLRIQTSPAEILKSSPHKSHMTECCQNGLSHSALSQQPAPGTSPLLAPGTGASLPHE